MGGAWSARERRGKGDREGPELLRPAYVHPASLERVIAHSTQQKSKPRNAHRETFAFACAEIPRALRLCRKLGSRARQKQAQNGDKIDAAKGLKITVLSIAVMLAGAPGLEPGNGGIKIQPIHVSRQRSF